MLPYFEPITTLVADKMYCMSEVKMDEDNARLLCEKNGCQLLAYDAGKAAYLAYPTGEMVMISIGTKTAGLFIKPLLGWKWASRIGSMIPMISLIPGLATRAASKYPISEWVPEWKNVDPRKRNELAVLLLDGLLDAFSTCHSEWEAKLMLGSWLNNPLDLAASAYEKLANNK
jgi:hypothetical protein